MGFVCSAVCICIHVESSWNVMAQCDAREGKWKGNCRLQWAASTLHTTSEHAVSSITTADAHTSAASSRLNWMPPANLNGLVRLVTKTKCMSFSCAITFQTQSTAPISIPIDGVNVWLLPGYYMVIARLLPSYCQAIPWLLPGYCLFLPVIAWLLPGYCLIAAW